MAEEFGRAVLIIEANDTALKRTLARDEKIVTTSVNKMQKSVNGLTDSSTKASVAMGVMGQAAAATGNAAINSAAQYGTFAVGLQGYATAAFTATAATRGLTVAVATAAVGITAAVAAIAIWTVKIRRARQEIDKLTESEKRLERGIAARAALVDRIKSQEASLEKQLFIARGGTQAGFLVSQRAGGQRGLGRIITLTQELELIAKQKTAVALRLREEERLAAIKIQQLATEKAIVAQERAAADAARRARQFGGALATTGAEGRSQFQAARVGLFKQDQSTQLILRAALKAFEQGGIASSSILRVLGRLGISLDGQEGGGRARGETGAIGLAAFASTGRGASLGVIRSGQVAQKAETRDNKRNTLLEDMKAALVTIRDRQVGLQ